MYSQTYNEKRIKRLEIAVIILSILFIISVTVSIYSAIQIRTVASKVPSYKEIKEDIKALNNLYKISEVKVPKAYNYTKEKAVEGYDYTKEKASELMNYFKEKTEENKSNGK
jgi:predicted PurR-regulated permease PerM